MLPVARGAKNFATALEQELKTRVIITENGRRKGRTIAILRIGETIGWVGT
jgi:hypothetical protein